MIPSLALFLSACSPTVRNPMPLDQLATETANSPFKEYLIQPGDQLDIKFYYNPELNEQITVRPDGRISLQLAGEIDAVGRTPANLTDLLTEKYSAELNDPKITVIVRTFNLQRIYVDGEVKNPGLFTLMEPTTILQSIAQAGGLKESARTKEIVLIRRSADNTFTSTVIDLETSLDGSSPQQDIALMPQDIIYVPRSRIANVNRWIDQYIRRNIPVPLSIGAAITP